MKDFSNSLKQSIYTLMGQTSTINSQTVTNYVTPPRSPVDYYTWVDLIGYTDEGTKDKFIGDVRLDIVCVTKVNGAVPDSELLGLIGNDALTKLVSKGDGIADPTNTFEFFSVVLNDLIEDKEIVGNKTMLYKRLRLTIKCQEL